MNLVVNQAKAGAACKCGRPASLTLFVVLDNKSERDCCFICAPSRWAGRCCRWRCAG